MRSHSCFRATFGNFVKPSGLARTVFDSLSTFYFYTRCSISSVTWSRRRLITWLAESRPMVMP